MAPIFTVIDLKDHLNETEGSFQTKITEGSRSAIDLETTKRIALDEASVPVRLERAQLHYDVTVGYSGPELAGGITAHVYLAPVGEDELFQEKYLLASRSVALVEDHTPFELAGTITANETQIEAVNEKELRLGIRLMGDVTSASTGTATFHYTIDTLRLRVGFSLL